MVDMYALMRRLYPICRSLTGDGNRRTLSVLAETVRTLRTREIPTGTKVFDWTVPREWNCRGGHLDGPDGKRIVDFAESNLHVVGYSTPVDVRLTLDELQDHLYSMPAQPEWTPYVTSYYKERWGFCLPDRVRKTLPPGRYHAVIESTLENGSMTIADAVLPGESDREVLLTTYICHPSLANNELSGPCVAAALYEWLDSLPRRRLTYRFVFAPETIGSIAYLSLNLDVLKQRMIAGYNLTCVGDDRAYSYMPSRRGDTLADRVALKVLRAEHPDFIAYSFLQRGSDERQYCSPGVDLPLCSVMRSKYGSYPEYHTSADDLSLVTPTGLKGSFDLYRSMIELLERNCTYRTTVLCEPQLGSRGLYPTISYKGSVDRQVFIMKNVLSYADGAHDLISLSDQIGIPVRDLYSVVDRLVESGLLAAVDR